MDNKLKETIAAHKNQRIIVHSVIRIIPMGELGAEQRAGSYYFLMLQA